MNKKAQIRNICIFVIIALSLLWIPKVASQYVSETIDKSLFNPLGIFSPLLAAVIVRRFISREGFQDAGLGIRGVRLKYWLLAIFLPLIWHGIGGLFLWSQGFYKIDSVINSHFSSLVLIFIIAFTYLFSEEFGWRGYLVQKLSSFGWHVAFIVTGIVWFLWHPQHVIGNSILNKFVSLIFIMLLSYVFGWLFLRSKSVWPCVIMHSFQNESQPQGIFNMSKTPTDIQENVVICIVLLIVTVILFLLEHPITGESIFKHNKYMGLKQK